MRALDIKRHKYRTTKNKPYMKRIFTFILTISCLVHAATDIQAQEVTAEQAKKTAESFFAQATPQTRGIQAEICKVWDSSILEQGIATRSAAEEAPTFHTFAADNGFVIIAGEQGVTPVIGYSFENSISSELPAGMADYLTDIHNQIKAKRAAGITTRAAVTDATTIGNVVVNLNTAKWGQNSPFNKLCFTKSGAQAKTGCVPTAFAIIMRHHKWPESRLKKLYNPITGVPVDAGEAYDWDSMPLEYTAGEYTEEEATQVATVMRDLGYAYGVSYGTGSTDGTPSADKMSKYFGYVEVTTDHSANGMSARWFVGEEKWPSLIKESLDAGCPIPYQATNSGSGSDAKHIFVLDGYTDNEYFHFNWGWNGSFNGYFTLKKMDPTATDEYAGGGISNHNAIFNLKPLKEETKAEAKVSVSVNDPEGGTATVNGSGSATVEAGTEVTLVATPYEGYLFENWTANGTVVSDATALTVTANENIEYVANFMKEVEDTIEYTITATATEGGTATVNGISSATVEAGSELTLIAYANMGYTFTGWTVNGIEASKESVFKTTATQNATYQANFVANSTKVTISLKGSGGYKYINDDRSGECEVNVGSLVTLIADGSEFGNIFAFFTLDKTYKNGGTIVSNKNPYQFIATEDATFYMNFLYFGNLTPEDLTTEVNIKATEGGSALVQGYTTNIISLGEEITLRATANAGYTFTGWTDSDNQIISTSPMYTLVVKGPITYTANFEPVETGVEEITVEEKTTIYDLSGRKIEKITKPGIYIINGKKRIVR